ncbi:MAG: DEAD/DEAH box helicase [Clostridia bacterium]|nr:DEAD/DEAH box helicase [Clostridia bacterium]
MDIIRLSGVGRVRASHLEAIGIRSTDDLLRFAPISYRDLSKTTSYDDLVVGTYALISAKVSKISKQFYSRKCKITVSFENCKIKAVWFNAPYVSTILKPQVEYLFYGKICKMKNNISIVNPTIDDVNNPKKLSGIVPVYRTQGVSSSFIWGLVKETLEIAPMPYEVVSDVEGIDAREYFRKLHTPATSEDIEVATRHLALADLLSTVTAYRINSRDKLFTRLHKYTYFDYSDILSKLPYTLTPSQQSAISDVVEDLHEEKSMNRIVYGDVGSGKSIVAYISMSMAVRSGHNSALMCPTEILALQHYNNLVSLFGEEKVRLVTSSHNYRFDDIEAVSFRGYIVGTQALLSDRGIRDLAMVVIDEQQRFGVKQRHAIESISMADTLILTATPIPRTYMLALSGILDESKIDRPSTRQVVKTRVIPDKKVNDMYEFIVKQASEGRQTFIVCPRIYDEDGEEISSVESLYPILKSKMGDILGYVHGKMSARDRQSVIDAYQSGDIKVLLATTVIEVGIDVKNAYIMVVVNAEKYGLASLHQLRGRVGRGSEGGYCFLILSPDASESAKRRVEILTTCSDGDEISRYDYDMRGGGDMFSLVQSGKSDRHVDTDLILEVRRLSDKIMSNPQLLHNYTQNQYNSSLNNILGVTLD